MKDFKELNQLKTLLDQQYTWPSFYTFKFVVPASERQALQELLPGGEFSERHSSSGRFVSVTMKRRVRSSGEVLNIYHSVREIEGLIAL